MKRVRDNKKEVMENGISITGQELDMFNFMNKRAEAFEKNELDPDVLKKLVEELKSSKGNRRK